MSKHVHCYYLDWDENANAGDRWVCPSNDELLETIKRLTTALVLTTEQREAVKVERDLYKTALQEMGFEEYGHGKRV
jgi:hypothetical protein